MRDLDIMHVDMDAFFASVEQFDNPDLKGKPVIIGGSSLGNRGVVSTASYEARKFGVHSAMPIVKARQLCPQGVYLPGRMERYQEISQKIQDIFQLYTPLVEKVSIDEAFLDIKGCHRLFGTSVEIAALIKNKIKQETGLTASIGIAPNKFLAKLASDLEKPNGLTIIPADKIGEILNPLPVSKIWGVGKKTEEILQKKGVKTIGMLKKISLNSLENLLGKSGHQLYYLARGIDDRTVVLEHEIKSISHEETFKVNLNQREDIFAVLMDMSERVSRRMRLKGLRGSTIFIKIRYGDFSTYTRRITLDRSINTTDDIYRSGKKLLEENNLLNRPVRLLGVGVGSLSDRVEDQLSLFSSQTRKEELTTTIDEIKDRFGERSIQRARNLLFKK